MAAFSPAFSPTGFFAGAAPSITTQVSRAVAEFLGTFTEASVSRITAEVLDAPELWKAEVTRIAVEQLSEATPHAGDLVRYVVEVLGDTAYSVPVPTGTVQRVVAEFLGTAADSVGKNGNVLRIATEVLGSVLGQHRGMLLPAIPGQGSTLLLAAELDASQDGHWSLTTADGYGFFVQWTAAVGTVQSGVVNPDGTQVITAQAITHPLFLRIDGPASAIALAQLGMQRDTSNTLVVKELMLFGNSSSPTAINSAANYLTRRWRDGIVSATPCNS